MANLNLAYGRQEVTEMPTLPVNGAKEGLHYDTCPQCDEEVEPYFKNGAGDGSGLGYHDFSIYAHQRQEGGCGLTWSRAGRQAIPRMQSRGITPKWVEGAAMRDAHISIPSEAYQDGWERIYGKKEEVHA